MIEVGDQFILPCGFNDEVFVVVGTRIFNGDTILEAMGKHNGIMISLNSKEVEPIGKEFKIR